MSYNLRSVSALSNSHMGTTSMLLYMPKESNLPKDKDDWVGELMRELNEENVRNQDLKLLMVSTTVELAGEKNAYPHLAPWK